MSDAVEKNVDRVRDDIGDLYEKHRQILVNQGLIDGRLKVLEDDKTQAIVRRANSIAAGGLLIGIIGIVAGILGVAL